MVELVGLPGSLRRGSHNRALLEAAADLAPPGVTFEVFDGLRDVPLFDADIAPESHAGVMTLVRTVNGADGVLIATPEYNQAVPGVLKNALDWISRTSPGLVGKPVAVTGATTGPWGTRIAQTMLRQILTSMGAHVAPAPALFVNHADAKFTDGVLTDGPTLERVAAIVEETASWAARVGPRRRDLYIV